MSGVTARRLLAKAPFSFTADLAPACRLQSPCLRQFSQTSRRRADEDANPASTFTINRTSNLRSRSTDGATPTRPQRAAGAPMMKLASDFSAMLNQNQQARAARSNTFPTSASDFSLVQRDRHAEPHHFHIYAHRHNCHITLTKPDRTPILSVSCGQIGFKNAARKSYDAAFQLASYVMGRITDRGIHLEIEKLEVTLRGYGLGREAVTKALMGSEGRFLRGKVVKVQDATRLKFGGTRSRKPRRLG